MNQQQQQHDPRSDVDPGRPADPRPALPRRVARAARRRLAAAQARFVRARGGSVLILVVALLVLIALAGTALITTARTDRYATAQNTANTQIEMLVEAAVRLSKAQIIDDLFGADQYRPPTAEPGVTFTPTAPGAYEHYDAPQNDDWMASRVPARPAAGGAPYWPFISSAMVTGSAFESPDGARTSPARRATYFERTRMEPTFMQVGGETVPALYAWRNPYGYDPSGAPAAPVREGPYIAADADGDGIADAGLWRIPVGQLNGVTYYAAVRIIDNSAAFNANVHWVSNRDSSAAPSIPADLFTTNVDFEKAFFQYGGTDAGFNWPGPPAGFYQNFSREWQMYGLNLFRTSDPAYVAGATPPASTPPTNTSLQRPPVADDNLTATRADFDWISPYDQWYHQLARRLDNPGYYMLATASAPAQRFRALTSEDATALAYRFLLRNPNSLVASPLEQMLLPTLEFPVDPFRPAGATARTTRTRTQPYPSPSATVPAAQFPTQAAAAVNRWFNDNFDMLSPTREWSRRTVTVTRNPLSNGSQIRSMEALATRTPQVIGNQDDRMQRRDNQPFTPRTSINTANFGELWRAYWSVMDASGTANDANNDTVHDAAAAMFRSPLRRPQPGNTTFLSPQDTLLLRAALAAVNAEDFRDSDTYTDGTDVNQNVSSHRIHVKATVNGSETPVEITVFGNEAQPFITEVYANNDASQRPTPPTVPPDPAAPPFQQNPKGYVAVELYNPTNVTINLTGWHLGIIRRTTTATAPALAYPDMLVMPITGFNGFSGTPGPMTIPAGGRLVLENYNNGNPGDNAAQYRPASVGAAIGASVKYVKNLHEVIKDGTVIPDSGELVLLRPRRGDGRPTNQPAASGGGFEWQELNTAGPGSVNLDELVPLDSFDFTGFELADAAAANSFREMHYVRHNVGTAENRWKCVYPGRWLEPGGTGVRQEGMKVSATFAAQSPPWTGGNDGAQDIRLGQPDDASGFPNPYPGIQLNNKDFAGPNPVKASANRFPFGGFARNGDILQVPFIGGYTIRTEANANAPRGAGGVGRSLLVEMNAITQDAGHAQDNELDTTGVTYAATNQFTFDDAYEQIGRFCPLSTLTAQYDPTATPARPATPQPDPYAWARDLFEHLTVDAPHADFLPNVRPEDYGTYTSTGSAALQRISPDPDRVEQNDSPAVIDGKINLNTAPARVLAAMNMWPSGTDANNAPSAAGANDQTFQNGVDDGNERLANMIVRWRDGDPITGTPPRGPFYSIADLNRVFDDSAGAVDHNKRFQSAGVPGNPRDAVGDNPTTADGDFSPRDASDEVTNDFEARYLMMNRISNLVSTRSDSYTVYVVVQGWRGVGTGNPTMVVQRRAAYLADRSGITDANRDFTPVVVPTN